MATVRILSCCLTPALHKLHQPQLLRPASSLLSPSLPLRNSYQSLVGRAKVPQGTPGRISIHEHTAMLLLCLEGTSELFLLPGTFAAFFRAAWTRRAGEAGAPFPAERSGKDPVPGAGAVEAALSTVPDALWEGWCQLTLPVALRSFRAAPGDMAFIRRIPKRLFICLLSGAGPPSCPSPPECGQELVWLGTGWSHMLTTSCYRRR